VPRPPKPCPFLVSDDRCTIYDVRPTVCREYPQTDKEGFSRRAMGVSNNALTCPAVFWIVEEVRAGGQENVGECGSDGRRRQPGARAGHFRLGRMAPVRRRAQQRRCAGGEKADKPHSSVLNDGRSGRLSASRSWPGEEADVVVFRGGGQLVVVHLFVPPRLTAMLVSQMFSSS
jgi:hypothetical protein